VKTIHPFLSSIKRDANKSKIGSFFLPHGLFPQLLGIFKQMPIACLYLHNITKFYSIISNSDKVKRVKLRYFCKSIADVHKIWHDDADMFRKCTAVENVNFKNRKITISHSDAERVSQRCRVQATLLNEQQQQQQLGHTSQQ